jgi:hypothetical protein
MDHKKEKKKTQLPARLDNLRQALETASSAMGLTAGSGRAFLRIDDRTGEATVGVGRDPFPLNDRYAVRVGSFAHGYVTFGEEGGTREMVVSMVDQPVCPAPAGGFVQRFGEAGAKPVMRIVLTSLDVPGYEATFDALGKSSANRIRNLIGDVITNREAEAGEAGFVHPVIKVTVDTYFHQAVGREISCFGYELIDWMNDAGELWNGSGGESGGSAAAAPWDETPGMRRRRRAAEARA